MARGAAFETVAVWMARTALAAVFVYAGAVKVLDPAAFARAIDHFRLLPHLLAPAMAVYLPWVEIVGGVGLFWPRGRAGALLLLLGLCLLFCAAITSALARGLDISCGCFGDGGESSPSLGFSLLRSMFLALIAWWLWWRETGTPAGEARSAESPGEPTHPPID